MADAFYIESFDAFSDFLTVYIHTLLYLRSVYPQNLFVQSRFHNTSAYQLRHPLVCNWIRDVVHAVRIELPGGTVSRICIVVFHYRSESKNDSAEKETGDVQIIERFMVNVSDFPVVNKDKRNSIMEGGSMPSSSASVGSAPLELDGEILGKDHIQRCHDEDEASPPGADTLLRRDHSCKDDEPNKPAFDIGVDVNLAEQMRAALISLTKCCAQLNPLPDKCSFNIAMELKDEADIQQPIRHPQTWIPVQPNLQKSRPKASRHTAVRDGGVDDPTRARSETDDGRNRGKVPGALRFTPIRTVETGIFKFELWIEEWQAKFEDMSDKTPDLPEFSFTKPKLSALSGE